MKYSGFYLYQVADILFTSSCRALAMLVAWLMINQYHQPVSLGWLITLSWLSQIMVLIGLSFISSRMDKKTTLVLCSLVGCLGLVGLSLSAEWGIAHLAALFLLTSVLSIIIQPIGNSIVPELFRGADLQSAFQVRGLINSINMVLGAAISGLVIHIFTTAQLLWILSVSVAGALLIFSGLKLKPSLNQEKSTFSATAAIRALIGNRLERRIVCIAALANFILTPTLFYITPIIVVEHYQGSAMLLGLAEAMFGLGMLCGGVCISRLNTLLSVRLNSVSSLILVAVGLGMVLMLPYLIGLLLGLAITGLGTVMFNINTNKIRCSATPEKLRNAFESIYLALCLIPIPFGLSLATLLVQSNHLSLTLAGFSVLIFGAAIMLYRSKYFQHIANLNDAELHECYPKLFANAYMKLT
ncbi:putative MFS family arabinose efflux permease [Acinetobacter calcoaceticus]|uniref:Putative MFS family arabinose efflux permease n=1 Tax=Acinetobacter calcoaceticus TaxID=471 RepID=A0A4R1XHE2_ACICA|nr:putative MFS family arabinose efflux permease [Acinetobacter calcoaceticus]